MGRFRAFCTMMVTTAITLIASSFVVAATAQAAPSAPLPARLDGCSVYRDGSSICHEGTGMQRAVAKCTPTNGGHTIQAEGDWAGRSEWSRAKCPSGYSVDIPTIEHK